MSYKITKKHTKKEVLGLMDPLIEEWFRSKFSKLTEPQSYAVPHIHNRKNVLICSPTGSGKTLTAFLSIINELYNKQQEGELEDRIYCLYISPLKALANDIKRNLTTPLEELTALAEETDRPKPKIRTGVRSGDTTTAERAKMARKPPHIFITTPESLAIILSTPKFSQNLEGLEYLIVDEIHDLCNNKRGSMLSLNMERLQERAGNFTRVGLSATQAPIEKVADYLSGYEFKKKKKTTREMGIVEATTRRDLDLEVLSPVDDITALPFEVVNDRMYDMLGELIKDHKTTLVFTNTRAGTETVSYKLQERGIEKIAAHHGSLSKETRLEVEETLKAGELKAAVSSTSLELGIDIGSIDLVCQIGSPKSTSKGLQRIGRAGHSVGLVPTGRLIVFESDDLVECSVLARNAKEGRIDRVFIPENSLDILAQILVGMSLEKRWDIDEAYKVVTRSYPYRNLTKKRYLSVLEYLGARDSDYVYSKIWYDKEDNSFGKKKGARMIYYLNLGAIPDESNYIVFAKNGRRLGKLSEKFVERLTPGDIFVLGGQSYSYTRTRGTKVYVDDSPGRKPTVPSWSGEMLPRSFDLSTSIGAFRRIFSEKIFSGASEKELLKYLYKNYHVDEGSAKSILSYVKEQHDFDPRLPTDKRLMIEGYIDMRGRYNLIFHACHGRRVNDALSRAYAMAVSNRYQCNVSVSITDDNFMLILPKRLPPEDIASLVTSSNLEELLRSAVMGTEFFKQRFRHCASRSFMVLRNYRGKEISVSRQQNRSERIMEVILHDENHPVVWETYNEILNQAMDLDNAKEVLMDIESGEREVITTPYADVPSPFAHNVVLAGISDIVLMEDRSTLLRELHRQVLERIMPEDKVKSFSFDAEVVHAYFEKKAPSINSREDILAALETLGPLNLTQHKGDNIYAYTTDPDGMKKEAEKLIEEQKVVSLWRRDLLWTLPDEASLHTVLSRKEADEFLAEPILELLKNTPMTLPELKEAIDAETVEDALKHMERANMVCRVGRLGKEYLYAPRPKKRNTKTDRENFICKSISRVLGAHGPMTKEEVAYRTGINGDTTLEHLNLLEREGNIEAGYFVVGDDIQYMLARDVAHLRYGEALTHNELNKIWWRKHTTVADSLEAYYERYPTVARPYDLYPRTTAKAVKEWKKKRKNGDIIEGKFEDGRMSYIRKEDAGLYITAFRRREARGLEKELYDFIANRDGVTSDEIKKDFDNNMRIKDALAFLDKNMYLVKAYTGVDGWAKRSIYVPTTRAAKGTWEGTDEEAWTEIMRRFIRTYGPVSLQSLRFSGLRDPQRRVALKNLEGEIEKINIVMGRSTQEHLILKDDQHLLEKITEEDDKVYIMSLFDPYVQPMWAEINARYGEKWIYPLLREGDLLGAIERWDMSGCHEIRDIMLDDHSNIPAVAKAIKAEYKHHVNEGLDVVRIRMLEGEPVTTWPKPAVKAFTDLGFVKIGDMLVLGPVVENNFPKDVLIKYTMAKQHLGKYKLADTLNMVKAHGGARRDGEIESRVKSKTSIDSYLREGVLVGIKAVPDILMYATPKQAELYQAARGKRITKNMNFVYETYENVGALKPWKSPQLFNVSEGAAWDESKKLFQGTYLARNANNEYTPIKRSKLKKKEARKLLIKDMFKQFGTFSVALMASFLRGEFRTGEIREILDELVKDGTLVKGFLKEGDDELFWMLASDLNKVEKTQAKPTGIITSDDRLIYYLSPEIRENFGMNTGYLVLKDGELIGAFKATKKKNNMEIQQFEGSVEARRMADAFVRPHQKEVIADEEWEIIEYVSKHIKGAKDGSNTKEKRRR